MSLVLFLSLRGSISGYPLPCVRFRNHFILHPWMNAMESTLYQNEPEKPIRGEPRPVAADFCQIKDKCCLVCSES